MKPLLTGLFLVIICSFASAQSADYLSVRKKNGRVVKNFYSGSYIQLITVDNSYIDGPIKAIRNDTAFIILYDIRSYRTTFGSIVRDTISAQVLGLSYHDIKRVQLSTRTSAFQRLVPPLMMIGGAGYLTLNILNGAVLNQSVSDSKNLRKLGISGGLFCLGFLLHKLFKQDDFTTSKHRIVYVDL